MRSILAFAMWSCVCHEPVGCRADPIPLVLSFTKNAEQQGFVGLVHDFGYQFRDQRAYVANLFVPPSTDKSLCQYPDALVNIDLDRIKDNYNYPIALLVSQEQCSFEQMAQVALEIRKNVTDQLKFIVLYNNNSDPFSDLPSTNITESRLKDLQSLGFIFVSTQMVNDIVGALLANSASQGASPVFGQNTSFNWSFPLRIENFDQPNTGTTGDYPSQSSGAGNAFYWLRFVLFSLLILSPCVRAAFLWYTAGGRILFRRNGDGQIIGIQYVRPMAYWFAFGVAEPDVAKVDSRLTDDQVLALPEISYTLSSQREIDSSTVPETAETPTNLTQSQTPLMDSALIPQQHTVNQGVALSDDLSTAQRRPEQPEGSRLETEPASNITSSESGPEASRSIDSVKYSISCTMCSICIDDFEAGEKVRVLPKCRHGFHLECIRPWLTERQGCCPLCKTPVMGQEDIAPSEQGNTTSEHTSHHDPPA